MQATLQNVLRDMSLVFTYLSAAPWMFWVWVILAFMLGMLVVQIYYHKQRREFGVWRRTQQQLTRTMQATRRQEEVNRVRAIHWRG